MLLGSLFFLPHGSNGAGTVAITTIVTDPTPPTSGSISTITVSWDYATTDADYFSLYIDGTFSCETDPGTGTLREYSCDVNFVTPGSKLFTMTATDAQGEGPHSAPFVLDVFEYDGTGNYIPNAAIQYTSPSGTPPIAPADIDFDGSSSIDFDGSLISYDCQVGVGIFQHRFDGKNVPSCL